MPEPDRELSPQPAGGTTTLTDQGIEREAESQASIPTFSPLFTILTNSTTNTTLHPRVHYLFSDDDPSILTAASAVDDPSHRAIVVDLASSTSFNDPNRWSVSWASSLTPDFAITSSSISTQHAESDVDADASALMLRLEGVQREPVEVSLDSLPSSRSGALEREDLDGVVEDFKRRMGDLNRVVGEGKRRREALARHEEAEHVDVVGVIEPHDARQHEDTRGSERLGE